MMSNDRFDARLRHIEEQHAARRESAVAYRDQEMAKLFIDSGWTQQQIAERVSRVTGKPIQQQYVSYRINFGLFLEFTTTGGKAEIATNLTERRFRDLYRRSEGKQETRFAQVLHSLEHSIPQSIDAMRNKPGLRNAVIERLSDRQWYTVKQLAQKLEEVLPGVAEQQLTASVGSIWRQPPEGFKLEKKKLDARSVQYRLTKVRTQKDGEPPVAIINLYESAKPLIDELDQIGHMHECRMSPAAVRSIAIKLKKLFDAVLEESKV